MRALTLTMAQDVTGFGVGETLAIHLFY